MARKAVRRKKHYILRRLYLLIGRIPPEEAKKQASELAAIGFLHPQ
jgi:hypothetical protein